MKRQDRLDVTMTIEWSGKPNRKHFLRHLIETHGIKIMAEVGVRDGRTTFFLLDHCPELIIYAIDRNTKLFYNDTVKTKYQSRLIPVQGDSSSVADDFSDGMFDLIFIDADHSYNGVKKDITKYQPKLSANGFLTGHDIDYPGVNQAVKELIKNYDIGPNFVWIAKK